MKSGDFVFELLGNKVYILLINFNQKILLSDNLQRTEARNFNCSLSFSDTYKTKIKPALKNGSITFKLMNILKLDASVKNLSKTFRIPHVRYLVERVSIAAKWFFTKGIGPVKNASVSATGAWCFSNLYFHSWEHLDYASDQGT